MLNNFMAGFLLYNFNASYKWWIGFIVVILFEVLYELDQLEKSRRVLKFKEKKDE